MQQLALQSGKNDAFAVEFAAEQCIKTRLDFLGAALPAFVRRTLTCETKHRCELSGTPSECVSGQRVSPP
mgnify:CR=1 FL=1